jgi:predicted helicase
MFERYINEMNALMARGDDQEASLLSLLHALLSSLQSGIDIIQLDQDSAFRLPRWQIKQQDQLIGYIDSVPPTIKLAEWEQQPAFQWIQLNFDNLLLLNFQEFRLYRHGELLLNVEIPLALFSTLKDEISTTSQQLETLFAEFLRFRLETASSSHSLASEAAKRARVLSEWIQASLDDSNTARNGLATLYQTLQININSSLTKLPFANQYAQAFVLYSLQPSAFDNIHSKTDQQNPLTTTWWPIVVKSFQNQLCQPFQLIRDEIDQLKGSNSLHSWWKNTVATNDKADPVLDFYKAFRASFDPASLFHRGIDKTNYPLANYVARAVHQLLKTQLSCQNGLADERIRVIHPASSFCTLTIEMMKLAVKTHIDQYGIRGQSQLFENHIQPHFIALEQRLDFFAWGALNASFASTSFVASGQPFQLLLSSQFFQEKTTWINTPVFVESENTTHPKQKPLTVIVCNTFQLQDISPLSKHITSLIQEPQPDLPGFLEIEGKRFPLSQPSSLRDPMVVTIRITQTLMLLQEQGISALIVPQKLLHHPDYRGLRASLIQTMNEIYILNLHGSALHNEHVPDGSQDENVFDEEQGVAVLFLIKRHEQTDCKIYHADLFGARRVKENWLKHTDFELYNYQPIKPTSPRFVFSPYDLYAKQAYQSWKSLVEIMPLYQFVPKITEPSWIDRDKAQLIERLLDNQQKQTYAARFGTLQPTPKSALSFEKEIIPFDVKPFEEQFVYVPEKGTSAECQQAVQHFVHPNVALVISQNTLRGKGEMAFSGFVTAHFIAQPFLSNRPSVNEFLFPLHLFDSTEPESKQPRQTMLSLFEPEEVYLQSSYNMDKQLIKQLATGYGKKVDAETLFHYLYAILWSNHYQSIAAQHQTNSLPRIPFPIDRSVFDQLALKGQQLIALHAHHSFLSNSEDTPHYYAVVDNRKIEASYFNEKEARVYINSTNYIEPITASQWQFAIGDHTILPQLLTGDTMDPATELRFCSMTTLISNTIKLSEQIDGLFDEAMTATISFSG